MIERRWRIGPRTAALAAVLLCAWVAPRSWAAESTAHAPPGEVPRLWLLGSLPFLAILLAIAVLPLVPRLHHWWESNWNRLALSLVCAGLTLLYYSTVAQVGLGGVLRVLDHALLDEYVPFIVLLFSLYVVSGGISLRGDLEAKPWVNTAFLAVGTGLASFIGTTGASMLLIRPLLKTNSERQNTVHTVVFFIFLVSNIGGTLLPIGDPPLFLGYLKGVPFFWTLGLWREWVLVSIALLAIYFAWDLVAYRRETVLARRLDHVEREPLRVEGTINFLWLAGIVAAVAFVVPGQPLAATAVVVPPFVREGLMLIFVALSLVTTPGGVRERNQFNYAAIAEVAALFIGIFVAMQVPVEVLRVRGADLGLTTPWHFFWMTGGLSSVLDNAPTYVVFFETAASLTHAPGPGVVELVHGDFIRQDLLVGISLGAVFLGAMTYIGNGPNFMVKAIAEQTGLRMPTFFGYVFRYSLPILVPVFLVVSWLFLSADGPWSAAMAP